MDYPFNVLIEDFILPLLGEDESQVRAEENEDVEEAEDIEEEPDEPKNETIENLMKILRNDEMIDLLEIVHQTLLPYYSHYSNRDGLMDKEGFIEFCNDFTIFPEILA